MEEFRVLLIDDQTAYSNSLAKALSTYGVTIRRANNSNTALGEIQNRKIDVVILDVSIPDIDGIKLLKQIKAIDPLVEVILLAGRADLSVAIQGMELGAFDFLLKSIDMDELVYKLKDAFEKKTIRKEKILKIRHAMEKKG